MACVCFSSRGYPIAITIASLPSRSSLCLFSPNRRMDGAAESSVSYRGWLRRCCRSSGRDWAGVWPRRRTSNWLPMLHVLLTGCVVETGLSQEGVEVQSRGGWFCAKNTPKSPQKTPPQHQPGSTPNSPLAINTPNSLSVSPYVKPSSVANCTTGPAPAVIISPATQHAMPNDATRPTKCSLRRVKAGKTGSAR